MTVYPHITDDLELAKSRIKILLNEGWTRHNHAIDEYSNEVTAIEDIKNSMDVDKVCLLGAIIRANLTTNLKRKIFDTLTDTVRNVYAYKGVPYFNDQIARDVNDVIKLVDQV